jgi:hypothetical protein
MANPATLESLRQRCRERTDKVNSTFVKTAEWNELINQSWTELYGLLITAYADYYATPISMAVTNNVEYTELPSDFFKLRAAFPLDGTQRLPRLRQVDITDLGQSSYPYVRSTQTIYGYVLVGSRIYWAPKPTASSTVEFWYVPQPQRLVSDQDVISSQVVDGWDEYIVNDVAMKVRLKEEGDAAPHAALKQRFIDRVIGECSSRDAGMPGKVLDVERANIYWPEWLM